MCYNYRYYPMPHMYRWLLHSLTHSTRVAMTLLTPIPTVICITMVCAVLCGAECLCILSWNCIFSTQNNEKDTAIRQRNSFTAVLRLSEMPKKLFASGKWPAYLAWSLWRILICGTDISPPSLPPSARHHIMGWSGRSIHPLMLTFIQAFIHSFAHCLMLWDGPS